MADWRQIQARIRKAKNSPDAPTKLSELYQRTRDAMVAWELALIEEKAGTNGRSRASGTRSPRSVFVAPIGKRKLKRRSRAWASSCRRPLSKSPQHPLLPAPKVVRGLLRSERVCTYWRESQMPLALGEIPEHEVKPPLLKNPMNRLRAFLSPPQHRTRLCPRAKLPRKSGGGVVAVDEVAVAAQR